MHASDIVAQPARRKHGNGRRERPGGLGGPRQPANRSGTGKASATGNGGKPANHRRKKRFRSRRGSSLRIFFDACCDRPGCYECFVRQRRSPRQRFCSRACRRAMERVWERERRWRRRRTGRHHHARSRPRHDNHEYCHRRRDELDILIPPRRRLTFSLCCAGPKKA